MANQQIGNKLGIPALGFGGTILGNISADGANTVTVDRTQAISVGDNIDIINKTTGAVLASQRQVTGLTSAGVLTYSGGDVAAVPGTHVVVSGGAGAPTGPVSLSGGASESSGFVLPGSGSIAGMRARLTAFNASTYSSSVLDTMTENDMIYALREIEAVGSIS